MKLDGTIGQEVHVAAIAVAAALGLTGEHHRVIAHHRTAAQRRKANVAVRPGTEPTNRPNSAVDIFMRTPL